ncbi:MAG: amidohydrolase family protein [Balneolaceae bacterium]|nr:amidohydrolase family protein [Balneolaceae bacterium]
MMKKRITNTILLLALFISFTLIGCSTDTGEELLIFTNATIWNGIDSEARENAALVTRDGKVIEITDANDPNLPIDAETIDLEGRFVIPGLINAHGHVGMADGLQTGSDVHSVENVRDQLNLYAAYGITTVVSLGDEPQEAFDVRDEGDFAEHQNARLFMSGPVLNPGTPSEAREDVSELMENNPDWTKIRVDDGLGTRDKMSEEVYSAVIEASHSYEIPLAAHIVKLEDAKGILRNNGDLIAHSVRDEAVDEELINMMLERDVCITPTLTREVSVFIYADRPDFFDDPFFLKYADPDVIEELQQPEVLERFTGRSADFFRDALPLAKENMMALHNAGIRVAMGTDSGPPARFQGYFEHMEMEMMSDAGMNPAEILLSATRYAAECMGLDDSIGTLSEGKYADFVVLDEDPFEDVRNLRSIVAVYVGGRIIERPEN